MQAATFITSMKGAGFVLSAADEALAVTPASRLTDSQRHFIRQHKQELLAMLTGKKAEPITEPLTLTLPTPSGGAVTVLARDQAQAEQLRRFNPAPDPFHRQESAPLPVTGYPASIEALAEEIAEECGCTTEQALSILGPDDCRAIVGGDRDLVNCWRGYVGLAVQRGEFGRVKP